METILEIAGTMASWGPEAAETAFDREASVSARCIASIVLVLWITLLVAIPFALYHVFKTP